MVRSHTYLSVVIAGLLSAACANAANTPSRDSAPTTVQALRAASAACSIVSVSDVQAATGADRVEQVPASQSLEPVSTCLFAIGGTPSPRSVSVRFFESGGATGFNAIANRAAGAPASEPMLGLDLPAIWITEGSGQLLVLKGDRRLEVAPRGFDDARGVAFSIARLVIPSL